MISMKRMSVKKLFLYLIVITISSVLINIIFALLHSDLNEVTKQVEEDRKFLKNDEDVTLEGLHQKIWRQIYNLQEEGNCEEKKILYCENSRYLAGLGSMIHRYGVCMQIAFGLGRIWFIDQKVYEQFGGLRKFLRLESKKCGYLKEKYKNAYKYNVRHKKNYIVNSNTFNVNNTYKVMLYNLVGHFPHPSHIPTTIPYEIEKILSKHNITQPWLWFTSQFLGYLLRPYNEKFMQKIKNISDVLDLKHPYVAMHVRRGDKISTKEARLTSESEYFNKAEKYYNKNLPHSTQRVIYLASDDNKVKNNLEDLASDKYKIISRPSFHLENITRDRYTLGAIETMFIDLYFLVHSNYTVCTYSSNIGRLIFELKQTIYPFTSDNRVVSLDTLKPDYIWPTFFSRHFHLYYVTTSRNTLEKQIGNGIGKMITYEPGELFRVNMTNVICETGDICVVYCTLIKDRDPTILKVGYIFKNNLLKWPGNPEYHFYPKARK